MRLLRMLGDLAVRLLLLAVLGALLVRNVARRRRRPL